MQRFLGQNPIFVFLFISFSSPSLPYSRFFLLMSEYWVSRKKWTCKYCDVTINDDVPSRQQHENGLRHKGNVERSLRQAYKKSERDRRDESHAKREMEKIERVSGWRYA